MVQLRLGGLHPGTTVHFELSQDGVSFGRGQVTLEKGPLGWAEGRVAIQLEPGKYQLDAFVPAADGGAKLDRLDCPITVL